MKKGIQKISLFMYFIQFLIHSRPVNCNIIKTTRILVKRKQLFQQIRSTNLFLFHLKKPKLRCTSDLIT